MKWIGLTGNMGSGKSAVGEILKNFGYPVVSADLLAREAVKRQGPAWQKLVDCFGEGILSPDGEIDRRALGDTVFSNPKKLKDLEAIVHPRVRELSRDRRQSLESQGHRLAFYDVPLLFEKGLEGEFDFIVLVVSPEAQQIERLRLRDGLTEAQIRSRWSAQWPAEKKTDKVGFVIKNDGDFNYLEAQVRELVRQLGG